MTYAVQTPFTRRAALDNSGKPVTRYTSEGLTYAKLAETGAPSMPIYQAVAVTHDVFEQCASGSALSGIEAAILQAKFGGNPCSVLMSKAAAEALRSGEGSIEVHALEPGAPVQ